MAADDPITRRIVREAGVPGLDDLLGERLPLTDLRSLLLHVARRRSEARRPADLLADRRRDPTLAAAPLDAREMAAATLAAFDAAERFQPVELSPVAPLALNRVLGEIDQNNVLATVRGSEVQADPTTALTLEAALRRRGDDPPVRLCTCHRVLRLQRFDVPDAWQHFRLFTLVTAGRSEPGHGFELAALAEHLTVLLGLLARLGFESSDVRVADARRRGPLLDRVAEDVFPRLAAAFPEARLALDTGRTRAAGYYDGLMLEIAADGPDGRAIEVGDGGSTDWSFRLLADRRQRTFTSGVGLDRLVLAGATPPAP